jgi:hypothetical protein
MKEGLNIDRGPYTPTEGFGNSTKIRASPFSVKSPMKFRASIRRLVQSRLILGSLIFFIVLALIVTCLRPALTRHFESVQCGNQMSSIGVAARLWSNDNEGRVPPGLLSLQGELGATRILICPGDHTKPIPDGWAFIESRSSYEIVPRNISDTDTNKPFLRCKIHGHLGYPDGTVFDGKQRRGKVFW